MRTTLVLVAALLSGTASAACKDAAWLERPAIPNGEEANFEQMEAARQSVTAYIKEREAYLDCVKPEAFVHNYMVGRIMRTAQAFNKQRERFLQQKTAIAAN